MAEEESDQESERLREELESSLEVAVRLDVELRAVEYCSRFCQVVEEYAGRWQVPLPQLQVLRTALCCFTKGIASFPAESEQIQYVLSSLALSFFELLLFFGKDEFIEDPLKDILESFQECLTFLSRYKNVYLRLVKQVIKEGGPWENPVLQAILREDSEPKESVDHYLSSEISDFFEFRVRYLLACERIQEAVALSKSCIQHSEVGKNLYFQQAYLTCLYKASLYDHLQTEIAGIDGKDAVEIICNTEREEKDDLLLNLCKVFLLQQLQNGDMYYIWDLIFIWSKLQLRGNSSKQDFLEECQQLLLAATNVKIIFPFMKVIKTELGIEGLQLCVELCAYALQMDLCGDPTTKSLVYKMIAYLLPNDLEVCRACALSVFFLERTIESYNIVYCLYIHPDQEYHVDMSLIRNHIRFELLRIIKRGLYFDPEFWNLIMLRTNCLPLMGEKAIFVSFQEDDEKIMNKCAVKKHLKYPKEPVREISGPLRPQSKKRPARSTQIHSVPVEVPAKSLGNGTLKYRLRKQDNSCRRRSLRQHDMMQEGSLKQHDAIQKRPPRQSFSASSRYCIRRTDKTPEEPPKRRGRKPSILRIRRRGRPPKNLAIQAEKFAWTKQQKESLEKPVLHIEPKTPTASILSTEVFSVTNNEVVAINMSVPSNIQLDGCLENAAPSIHTLSNHLHPVLGQLGTGGYSESTGSKAETITVQIENETEQNTIADPILKTNESQEVSVMQPLVGISEISMQPLGDASVIPSKLSDEQSKEKQIYVACQRGNESSQQMNDAACDSLSRHSDGVMIEDLPIQSAVSTEVSPQSNIKQTLLGETDKEVAVLTVEANIVGDCIQQTSNTANNFVSPSTSAPQTQIHEVDKSVVLPISIINSEKDSCSVCSSNNHASKHRCLLCNREFLGGHIMRHAMGHLHKGTFTCVVCGRKIKRQTLMLKHLKAHVKKIKRRQLAQPGEMDSGCTPVENGTSTNCEHKPSAPHLKNKQKIPKQSASVENHINQHKTISQSQNDNPDSSVSGSDKLTDSMGTPRPNGSILKKKKGEGQEERFECPAQDCGKSFNRKWALKKHIRKVHQHDVKAHEYIMKWSKGKCQYCQRKFIHPQHYLDHLNRHGNDKKYFCLQMNCIERFKTAIDLSNHLKVHAEFQLQCAFAECKMTFSDCSALHEHECKHYPALPVEERLVINVNSCTLSSAVVRDQGQIPSSCNKTVAVEEPPLPNWKLRMESVEPKTYLQNLASKHNVPTNGDDDENIEQNQKSLVMRISSAEPLLNGHREEHNTSPAFSNLGENKTGKNEKEPDVDLGEVESTIKVYKSTENIHDLGTTEVNTERTNLSSISPENIADTAQNDTGNSTVKDSSLSKPPLRKVTTEEAIPYGCISKKPFVRPPPSSYLDEQFISMPKRRKTSSQKVDSTASVQASAESHNTQRHRCSKCFTVFNDLEALDSHLAQKKCQSLFGFDSDEESAW
ncbi:uncharacterized protein znf654 [Polypterus senegalus]|uniref:uncharacterized protein znf654 n=1 Tax=Polypterus senegalus TaxID=55291 RepID=UPI0019622B16|nr:uncharacterized protein znf654 [Polypterus senegalus]